MSKKFSNTRKFRDKVIEASKVIVSNVGSTLGPRGRTVILQQINRSPIVTKDGISVLRFLSLEDPIENAVVEIIRQAAEETNASTGDGTTTSTVLTNAILVEAEKHLAAGVPSIEIKRGIDKAVDVVVQVLKDMSKPISSLSDIENIATISANGDDAVGRMIAEAVDSIGKDGSITIKEGGALETSVEFVDGFRFDTGVASKKFLTDERTGTMKYNKPLFLITDEVIDEMSQIFPALELCARAKKPLIVIAEEVSGEALAALVMNAVRGTLKVAAIKPPAYGEERKAILSDLALSVGATFFSTEVVDARGISSVQLKDLGEAKFIESSKSKTTITNGKGDPDKIEERIDGIKAEIKETEDLHECERLQARISRLVSSVAVIYVGGNTEVEMIEKKHRVEDALEAVRSAQSEGIVVGSGVALLRARKAVYGDEEFVFSERWQSAGKHVVYAACEAPIRQILENAGEKVDLVINEILEGTPDTVYNIASEQYMNAFDAGIVDPVKVVRCALQNAASAAGALITTNYAIVETI